MTPAARVAAAITVLDAILDGRTAEQALSTWARGSRFAGSKDRAALRDLVFDALRCRASAAVMGGALTGRGLMIGRARAQELDLDAIFTGEGHAPAPLTQAEKTEPAEMNAAAQHDIPAALWPMWRDDLGANASAAAEAQRARASLYLRVNQTNGTTSEAIAALAADNIEVVICDDLPFGLRVMSNERRVKNAAAFNGGFVDIQDAASQMAMERLNLTGSVLDYCAGGGGKALAVADQNPQAHVFAHDINTGRTRDIAPRAARAGVNISVLEADTLRSQAPFDTVLCDAPCSGSGTWRRNPEAKWATTPEKIHEFNVLQGEVIAQAASYVGVKGCLVYMTCSVFHLENEAVVARFLQANPDWHQTGSWSRLPDANGDGFFQSVLRKKPC